MNRIINDSLYRECVERNAVCEQNRRFCRHDLQHMLDVARITYLLVLEACMVSNSLTSDMSGKEPLLKILIDADPKENATAINISGVLRQVKEIIFAAGLLHDIARWVEYETCENHAFAGARMAGEVLSRAGFTGAEQRLIIRAIAEHRTGGTEASQLGRYICRADDLARPCFHCAARDDCYKISHMETAGVLLY
ncbi:HD domain-containing protein [Sporotomaculum syntrophicum]|uniref:HD domain-containing protein n=1 Tax=Sporotomaculum syntrophicum TaxID=182264 RepID=UPI001FAB9814|nr:HD domain-containing protein [Sporotomaculum syntrophicum]